MREETYNLLETAVANHLTNLESMDEGDENRDQYYKETVGLAEKLIAADKDANEAWDKQERRELERKRNDDANEIERDKQELGWKRIGFEMAKVVVPVVISMIGYNAFQKRVMKYEETGRISSTAGRELHLPSFMKR